MRPFLAFVAVMACGSAAAGDSTLGADIKQGAQDAIADVVTSVKDWQLNAGRLRQLQNTLANGADPAAMAELEKLARAGNSTALNFMGWLLDHGKGGVPRDSYKAAAYFRAAAMKGDGNGLYNLALLLQQGRGVSANKVMAADLLKKAMLQHHKYAAVRLGMLAEETRKYEEAARAYSVASSDKIHDFAIYRQGVLTFRGPGGGSRPDTKNGLMLITRAATLWNAEAMATLTEIYGQGIFVPKNRVEAGKWMEILRQNPNRRGTPPPTRTTLGLSDAEVDQVKDAVKIWLHFHPAPATATRTNYETTIYQDV
ncbi:MAG: hypothetical protein OEL20_04400 [Sulfuritalea sp.]|nr:hypothetical protein [Sulfuritalea sp.]